MKRLTLGLLVLLVSAGCAHPVTTDTTELVRISEERPRTVRGETWDAPYCVQNARFDRVRVRRYSTNGHVRRATREVVATDVFGTLSSTRCARTPQLPVAQAFYCGDFDPTIVGADDASRDAEEMCLQPIKEPCSATRDLACRGATLLLSDVPQGWRITFEATTPEERMLELVDRHLARVDVFDVVRATPLEGDAQLRAVAMMSGVAARRLAPTFNDALARLREEVAAQTGERRQILLEMHQQAAQIIALMLSGPDETDAETQILEGRRVLAAQADRVGLLRDAAATEPEVDAAATREPVVASSSAAKPAVFRGRGDRPPFDEVDWLREVESKLGEAVCPGPVLIRPASLAGDELRAVQALGRIISNLGRETVSSLAQPNCTLLVHSPRNTAGLWQWEIDVQGTQVGKVNLQVASRYGEREAHVVLDPAEAATVRRTRVPRAVWIGVGVGFAATLIGALVVGASAGSGGPYDDIGNGFARAAWAVVISGD